MLGARVGAGLAVAVVLCALLAAWRACGRRPRMEARVARFLLLVLGVPLALLVPMFGARLGRSGSWQCDLCGRAEHRDACAGVVIRRTPWRDPGARRVLDTYAAWIEPLVGDHEHAWNPVGCHHRIAVVSCTMLYPPKGWFEHLPGVADQELAQRAARAFLAASSDQRRTWKGASQYLDTAEFGPWLAETFP